nr:IclR family transcriptional regulator C-terminal domain-containing protein [Gallaecimonas mangrovi]
MADTRLQPEDRDYVGALASGLTVLQAFDSEHARMTLTEVAKVTGMDRAKARRFLLTLHALDYLRKEGRYFTLAPKVLNLGQAYQASNPYRAVIQRHLESITDELGESSSLAVLDGQDVVYEIRSAARHRLMAITLAVGTRLPAAYSSMGRVLLAQMPSAELEEWLADWQPEAHTQNAITNVSALRQAIDKVRTEGFAMVDQELDLGLRSIAVPVFSASGVLLGAINVSTNAARVDHHTLLGKYLPRLKKTAEAIKKASQ